MVISSNVRSVQSTLQATESFRRMGESITTNEHAG
jgi:hypothetical protein